METIMKSPMPGYPADTSDAKYISGVSTILVATIQEAKDRISQIEYLFCSQLYPSFQLNPQSFQKIFSEAKEAAEVAYKQKEKELLLQIDKLQCQKQQILEENQLLLKMQKKLEVGTEELRQELMKKSKEVDEVMELQNKLLQINQTKLSLIVQKDIQLKEYEEKTSGLVSELESMGNKAKELLSGLRDKTEEVEKGKELQGNLLKKIESQALEMKNNEQLLIKYEKENRLLVTEVERLAYRADVLQKELEKKSSELDEVRKGQEKLLQQSDSLYVEGIKRGQVLEEFTEERKQLMDKQKGLENEVGKLQQNLSERTKESCEGMELHGKLLQQIEVKNSELLSEKRKRRDAITAYKQLKSQYNYLLKQRSLTPETCLPRHKMEDGNEIIRRNQTPVTSRAMENIKVSGVAGDVTKPLDEEEVLGDKKGAVFVRRSSPVSPSTSNINIVPKCTNSIKTCPPAGAKRPLSYWRDTRSHQSRVGPDPHDDFLDTPLENVRQNLGKAVRGENNNTDFPKPGPINMSLDDSDDQTQDMNADDGPQNLQKSPPKVGTSGYKYVGPVRKKTERENLKGVECKQCKKFYDAVLPGEGKNYNGGDKQNIRCEHHDGVSRHRYRYAPPSTPEGFWNIGFESEM
ncbi:hypothetical protein OROMI_014363 [Orobanche minor]